MDLGRCIHSGDIHILCWRQLRTLVAVKWSLCGKRLPLAIVRFPLTADITPNPFSPLSYNRLLVLKRRQ